MFGAVLKATNSSFQKGMAFCRSIYVKKVMKLLAFIFEQPSYVVYVLIQLYQSKPSNVTYLPTKTLIRFRIRPFRLECPLTHFR